MCTDDYKFRSYWATKPKICRRFKFLNQNDDSRTFILDISQFEQNGEMALHRVFQYVEDKGLNVDLYLFQLPQLDSVIVDGTQTYSIKFCIMPEKELILKMIRKKTNIHRQRQSCHRQSTDTLIFGPEKKTKQMERVIGDVIQSVKYWRWLHDKNRLSLKQAAIRVQIPKKSLDDYYLQLRIGELCEYNYIQNLNSKMGDLRAYNKKNQKKSMTGKLSNELKNLKCYSLVPDIEYDAGMQNKIGQEFGTSDLPGEESSNDSNEDEGAFFNMKNSDEVESKEIFGRFVADNKMDEEY